MRYIQDICSLKYNMSCIILKNNIQFYIDANEITDNELNDYLTILTFIYICVRMCIHLLHYFKCFKLFNV